MMSTFQHLIETFNMRVSGHPCTSSFKPLDYKDVGFTYWIRGDGKRFKALGEIYPYFYELRDKYEFDWTLFEYIPKFWEWLKLLPGAKCIRRIDMI